MTGTLFLGGSLIGVSFFNTILMVWLGLTVLLNAERRTWGVWMMGGGLLMGAAFFISHTVILGSELTLTPDGLNFWWAVGWIPVVLAPFAWYIVILWYTGFWNEPDSRLRRRHRLWLGFLSALAAGLILLMVLTPSLPSYTAIVQLDLSGLPAVAGIPVLFLVYPAFMILSILLATDALRSPAPTDRMMGDLARQRSRPWLMGASAVLLLVSLLVTLFIFWTVSSARTASFVRVLQTGVIFFDLVMALLITVAVILLGQAVVAYEVFTGKVLPRRGFFRHWRNAILLAAGYAGLIGWGTANNLHPIYSLLLTTLLMVVFYALYSWRSFVEREQFVARLRPFVSSQRLIHHLVNPDDDSQPRANTLFQAVCRDVLGASRARLMPSGSLAPLVGPPLAYPFPDGKNGTGETDTSSLGDLIFNDMSQITPLDPAKHGGLQWAIPLWAERGQIGVLLLGAKQDGGLYTQEEIEIGQASGERILDMLAGEQIARRLMALQRGRLAENRVMDRRTRRLLHDETLPTLHMALLRLSGLSRDEPALREAIQALSDAHRQVADLIRSAHTMPDSAGTCDLVETLHRMVENEFAGEFSGVTWAVLGEIPPLEPFVQEVVIGAAREAVRNAALHGRGSTPDRPLNLAISATGGAGLSLTITDDGVGIGARLDASGVPAGSGSGLALHSTMLAIVGGSLAVESAPGGGTQVVLTL